MSSFLQNPSPKDTRRASPGHPQDTRRTLAGHLQDTRRTYAGHAGHLQDTCRTPRGHPQDTQDTCRTLARHFAAVCAPQCVLRRPSAHSPLPRAWLRVRPIFFYMVHLCLPRGGGEGSGFFFSCVRIPWRPLGSGHAQFRSAHL